MTRQQDHPYFAQAHVRPERTPRLRLKPKAPVTGYVEGAWWPHTRDLATELPDLLEVLSVRLGPIDRVVYALNEWEDAPARIAMVGHTVRLDGYRFQPADTIYVLGVNRARIVLLVVPPNTEPARAHSMLMGAASPNDASTVEDLLTRGKPAATERTDTAVQAQQRWDSEGGARAR
ncbi:DUF5994 family protein [Rhodococcus olei]|uniref:DUF5994 family protein n=1 Tax=Rhodococcus olei TaxID=2161675 RepID=A0ABP8NPX9_9NOCA